MKFSGTKRCCMGFSAISGRQKTKLKNISLSFLKIAIIFMQIGIFDTVYCSCLSCFYQTDFYDFSTEKFLT